MKCALHSCPKMRRGSALDQYSCLYAPARRSFPSNLKVPSSTNSWAGIKVHDVDQDPLALRPRQPSCTPTSRCATSFAGSTRCGASGSGMCQGCAARGENPRDSTTARGPSCSSESGAGVVARSRDADKSSRAIAIPEPSRRPPRPLDRRGPLRRMESPSGESCDKPTVFPSFSDAFRGSQSYILEEIQKSIQRSIQKSILKV
jgi:hypothetical protein